MKVPLNIKILFEALPFFKIQVMAVKFYLSLTHAFCNNAWHLNIFLGFYFLSSTQVLVFLSWFSLRVI